MRRTLTGNRQYAHETAHASSACMSMVESQTSRPRIEFQEQADPDAPMDSIWIHDGCLNRANTEVVLNYASMVSALHELREDVPKFQEAVVDLFRSYQVSQEATREDLAKLGNRAKNVIQTYRQHEADRMRANATRS